MVNNGYWRLIGRGLLLRCPVCGQGKLFRRWFTMYDRCPICNFRFEREDGYFTGAMAINLVISELLVAVAIVPFAAMSGLNPAIPFWPIMLAGLPLPIMLPLIFFRHSRALWMSVDHWWNPPNYRPPQGI